MDEFDRASQFETLDRELRIAEQRRKIAITPDLGCGDCKGISHNAAKESCEDFKNCLADWQKVEHIKRIKGNSDA